MGLKINLGCGKTKKEGYIGLDVAPYADTQCDFEHDNIPYDNNSVDEIISNHVLEHLRDAQNCLNECWRVLKKDGVFKIKVPYGLWDGASKPVHYQCITACWFDWLRRKDIYEWYGYRSWDILKLEEIKNKKGEIYEIYCEMSPRK